MAIVKYKNQSGVTYAYESIPVWDPEKKQSRPKRVYLGRVDDETGEIIQAPRKKGRPKKDDGTADKVTSGEDNDYESLYMEASKRIEVLTFQLSEAKKREALLETENRKMKKALKDAAETISGAMKD